MDLTSFAENVWRLTSRIPKGRVSTYKEIARSLHSRGYRAVGHALHANPHPLRVPCHRVVCSDGSLGGYAYGKKKKQRLLQAEGIQIKAGKIADFKARNYRLSA